MAMHRKIVEAFEIFCGREIKAGDWLWCKREGSIDSGQAKVKLQQLIAFTQQGRSFVRKEL